MTAWTFPESVRYLEHLAPETLIPARVVGVARVAFLLDRLGNPQADLPVVHVAGSSGKGSTSAMIAAGLRESGYRVGLFRSPHLISYRERIAINADDVGEEQWLTAFGQVRPIAEAMSTNAYPGYAMGRPSHGEILLAMALLLFQASCVEWAVVETGMGGRLDATNVLASRLAVVTNISLEHTHILGSTLREIAGEKAAIIKPNSIAVTGVLEPEALGVIRERADAVGATLIEARYFAPVTARNQSIHGQTIGVTGSHWTFEASFALAGSYQLENVSVAITALQELRPIAPKITLEAVQRSLARVQVPGRLEVVRTHPLVVLDGAHSTAGAEALSRAITEVLASVPITLLFAAMADKDLDAMASALGSVAQTIVLTRAPGSPRAANLTRLSEAFGRFPNVTLIDGVESALHAAMDATADDGALIVAGSLYLVGWVRAVLLGIEVRQ